MRDLGSKSLSPDPRNQKHQPLRAPTRLRPPRRLGKKRRRTDVTEDEGPRMVPLRPLESMRPKIFGGGGNYGGRNRNGNYAPKKDLSHIMYYNCNKKGHYASKCPEPRKTVFFT